MPDIHWRDRVPGDNPEVTDLGDGAILLGRPTLIRIPTHPAHGDEGGKAVGIHARSRGACFRAECKCACVWWDLDSPIGAIECEEHGFGWFRWDVPTTDELVVLHLDNRVERRTWPPEDGDTLRGLQAAVSGYIEMVSFQPFTYRGQPIEVYVNEEGRINGMPPNTWGSAFLRAQTMFYGPIAFLRKVS